MLLRWNFEYMVTKHKRLSVFFIFVKETNILLNIDFIISILSHQITQLILKSAKNIIGVHNTLFYGSVSHDFGNCTYVIALELLRWAGRCCKTLFIKQLTSPFWFCHTFYNINLIIFNRLRRDGNLPKCCIIRGKVEK